jgi:hypothetical protein
MISNNTFDIMCLGILDHISQDILEFADALPRLTEARESKQGDMGDGSEAGGWREKGACTQVLMTSPGTYTRCIFA